MRWPWSARNGHESAEPVAGEESCRPRVERPSGAEVYICQSATGAKSVHRSEQAALNRAAMSKGAVVYAALVEIEEEAS